jgi:CubicO group peptidase (beta-lactamase class C family)
MKTSLIKLPVFLFSAILLFGCQGAPVSQGESSAADAGMSEERLSRIDSMLTEAIEKQQIPGAVALVARNGRIVYHKAFGMADNEAGRNMQPDDIFRIASQTKAITSTAVMMLWEEAKFSLDDPISRYIPEFAHPMVFESLNEADSSFTATPATKPITIRNLLTHTSGIGYGMIDDDNFRKIYQKAGIIDAFTTKDVTIEENIKKLARLPLHHEPGAAFTYSEGLDVLGYLIEIVSGMPLDQFFKERIFDPLGMEDTYFYLPDDKADRLVRKVGKVPGPPAVRYRLPHKGGQAILFRRRRTLQYGKGLCHFPADVPEQRGTERCAPAQQDHRGDHINRPGRSHAGSSRFRLRPCLWDPQCAWSPVGRKGQCGDL